MMEEMWGGGGERRGWEDQNEADSWLWGLTNRRGGTVCLGRGYRKTGCGDPGTGRLCCIRPTWPLPHGASSPQDSTVTAKLNPQVPGRWGDGTVQRGLCGKPWLPFWTV